MKIDRMNTDSMKVEEKNIRAINTNYQAEGKAKEALSAEKQKHNEKPSEIEVRKKQAQQDAMKIAKDAWDGARIIAHEPKVNASAKREKMENIQVSFKAEKTMQVASEPKKQSANVETVENQPEKTVTTKDKQQIRLDVEIEKPEIARKAKKEVTQTKPAEENMPMKAEEKPQTESADMKTENQTTKVASISETDTKKQNSQNEFSFEGKENFQIEEADTKAEQILKEEQAAKEEKLAKAEQESEKKEVSKEDGYFEKIKEEQAEKEAKSKALREEELQKQEAKELERKEETQKQVAEEELETEIKKEEKQQIQEQEREEEQIRKEERRAELMEDMSKTVEKLTVMDGIQNGVYDKVENLLDERLLLEEDVKGIIVDENV